MANARPYANGGRNGTPDRQDPGAVDRVAGVCITSLQGEERTCEAFDVQGRECGVIIPQTWLRWRSRTLSGDGHTSDSPRKR
jgi:hypothetical protein